jgi:acyl dehydratase
MGVSTRHVLEQGPVLAALGRAALSGLGPRRPHREGSPAAVPGPWIERELPPRPEALIRDYVRNVGGDPAWYRGRVPAHLFPQWAFPLAARAIAQLPYPLVRVMNAGCRIEQRAPLPAAEPLRVRARLQSVDDDGRRAILVQRIETGTRSAPDALVAEMRAFVPLAKGDAVGASRESNGGNGAARVPVATPKERPSVPGSARELAFLRVAADAGLDFAKLTGDANPVHWLAPYARAAGFRACILHGFGTLARAVEALNRARFAGDPAQLATIDVRFTRPLVLPARVGVYVEGNRIWVGDAPGGGAYLEGRFDTEGARS